MKAGFVVMGEMRKILKKSAGMSLLEVLVALTILAVGVLGAAGTILTVMKNENLNENSSTALLIMQDKNERFSNFDFSDISESTENNLTVDSNGDIVTDSQSGKFTRTVTVSQIGANPLSETAKITVEVSWGSINSVSTSTIYSYD